MSSFNIRLFLILSILTALVIGAAVDVEQRDVFDDIKNGATSVFGDVTSAVAGVTDVATSIASQATSVFGDVTQDIPSAVDRLTSAGGVATSVVRDAAGSALTVVTSAGGAAITLATGAGGQVTSFAGAEYTVLTRNSDNAALSTLRVFETPSLAGALTIMLSAVVGVFMTLA